MKVGFTKRARQAYDARRRVRHVAARLRGTEVGDVRLAVPVLSQAQINQLREIGDTLKAMLSAVEQLDLALDCLRGENHPEGWATVEVADVKENVLVATVRHHKPAASGHDGPAATELRDRRRAEEERKRELRRRRRYARGR